QYPWGFLYYRAYPQSIFLPFGRPYGRFLYSILRIDYIDWEGYAYVGLTAFAGTLFFLYILVSKFVQRKYRQITSITYNRQLNILFWASLASLLFSFGVPFILGLERLIDFIGPIRQMRGIARFAWPFFYIMNILTIYWLWNWWKSKDKNLIAASVTTVALFMICTDAYYNVRNKGKSLENIMPALTDQNNEDPDNQWLQRLDLDRYQAIIPLPYFHIGSENIWLDGQCDIINKTFISVKNSGLPTMGSLLSRTSLNQTIENVSAITAPSCKNYYLNRYPTEMPFLLLVARCEKKYPHEKELIRHANWIDSTGVFDIYELHPKAFKIIQDSLFSNVVREYSSVNLHKFRDIYTTYSIRNFQFLTFDSLLNDTSFFGSGCLSGKAKNRTILYTGPVPSDDTTRTYNLTFWMSNIRTDLYPRTMITINETDSLGNKVNTLNFPVSKQIMQVSGNKALIEYEFHLADNSNQLNISAQNRILRNNMIQFDNILLRPVTTDVYISDGSTIWKNNFCYCKTD
ncbi:MAG TPA: hypothetical protein VHI78_02070, partial [Bacteroidales bacterium]|nr:hypothetical protein [Bacteroidales bacterium]